jgi:hypothetical protein
MRPTLHGRADVREFEARVPRAGGRLLGVGTWGTGVFSNDTAADLRDDFRDLVAEGMDAGAATAMLVAEYGIGSDPVIDHDFWLALAVTGHKIGHLTPESLAKAMQVIDDPNELARWPVASRRQRQVALTKARGLLSEPLPEPKRLRRRAKVDTTLEAGEHVQWHVGHRKPDAVFRVLDVRQDKGGRYPVLLALKWDGSERELHKAHRLSPLSGGFDKMRQREVALGFMACGRPSDPLDLQRLDARTDRKTPDVGRNYHQWVVSWTEMYRFFTVTGDAAVPPESPASTA